MTEPKMRALVCGVDCHPGDARCNGYCHDSRIAKPPMTIPPDTPTLLANASAGQLLDDAKWAEGMAALDIGTRIIVNGPDSPDRASLLRLAELARAVAALDELASRAAAQIPTAPPHWRVAPHGELHWAGIVGGSRSEVQSLCAALASTRHTQGEG